MPTKKDGTKHTWREFFKQWKEGMQKVTPLQQCITTQFGHVISGIGVIWGIIFSYRLEYYWMMVILIGGMIVLSMQYLANWQKKMIIKFPENYLRIMTEQMKGGFEDGD